MQVSVFGSSGKVGSQVVRLLLDEGHTVVALIHTTNPYKTTKGVRTVQGSVADSTAVEEVLRGSDAVVSTLGSWGTKTKDIVSTGTATIVAAMERQAVTRIITLTGAGALYQRDKLTALDKLTHSLLSLTAGKILKDGEDHLKLLEASQLDWTTVRSPIMTAKNNEAYRLTDRLPSMIALVPRAAVARCIVDQLVDRSYYQKAPVIRRG